jgi:acetyl esterase/lipase
MKERDRIDPQSREPLEGLLSFMPGGFNGIPDIGARREAVAGLLAAMGADRPVNPNVTQEDHVAPGPDGAPDVRVRVYSPVTADGVAQRKLPGLIYIHGGGMILGSIEGEEANAIAMCEKLGIVVASVDYRKSPENPYPAAPDDCYAGATWVFANAATLGIDAHNIGIYGGSAGGGLAIAVALMARDRSGPALKYMMPIYPMIDDRNVTHSSHEVTEVGIWDRAGNLEAWECYLGGKPADQYAAPTRATDLSNLPPAFIDVGQMDMFRDEDFDFAMRLNQAGVPCEFRVTPGAYHASETFAPEADLSKRIWAARYDALRRFIDA